MKKHYPEKKILFTFTLFIFLMACQSSTRQKQFEEIKAADEIEEIRQEMYDIHDSIMPEIGTMDKLRRCCNDAAKSMSDSVAVKDFQRCSKSLENARKAMFDWMFRLHELDKSTEALDIKKEQYIGETEKIKSVRDSMVQSMANAREILKLYEKTCGNL